MLGGTSGQLCVVSGQLYAVSGVISGLFRNVFFEKTTMTFDFKFETGFGYLSVARFLPPLFHPSTLKIAQDKVGSQQSEKLIGRTIGTCILLTISGGHLLWSSEPARDQKIMYSPMFTVTPGTNLVLIAVVNLARKDQKSPSTKVRVAQGGAGSLTRE